MMVQRTDLLTAISIIALMLASLATSVVMMPKNASTVSTPAGLTPECKLDTANIAHNATDIPPPITRTSNASVTIHLQTEEVCAEIEPGASYQYWTFNGTVPGPLIRVMVGDNVTIVLKNNDQLMVHSIDLHAVTGPGGGMMMTQTNPGQTSSFWFKALYPGLFVYHCATPPADMHLANGMYGMILVEPNGGLPHVDKEFYVMQGEFYTAGAKGMVGNHAFNFTKLLTGIPDYVVFNGRVGSLLNNTAFNGALHVQVNQTIRIFFGVGGPNLESYVHMIGQTFDKVYPLGTTNETTALYDVQTVPVPPGGSAILQLSFRVTGTYTLVDHSLSWAIEKGALGQFGVSGTSTPGIFG